MFEADGRVILGLRRLNAGWRPRGAAEAEGAELHFKAGLTTRSSFPRARSRGLDAGCSRTAPSFPRGAERCAPAPGPCPPPAGAAGGAAGRARKMLLLLPLLVPLLLAEGRRAAVLRLGLRGSALGEVSPAFLSLTLDASLAQNPRYIALVSNAKLRALATALSPGFLRFGGTKTDFLIFDPNKESTSEEKTLWELETQQGSALLSSMERRSMDLHHSPWQELYEPWQREEGRRGTQVQASICWNIPFATSCFPQQPWELPHCLGGSQEACGLRPAFAAVQKVLLAQWPSQEKLILAEYNRKKHKNTTITRNTLDILYSFANCSGFHLIFGLNALLRKDGLQWDSSNAHLLLDYCASQGYNISWELGNEPNSFRKKSGIHIDGFQLGQDFIHLRQLLSSYSLYRHAQLYGPDVGQPRKRTQSLLRSFLKSGGKVINSVTWHHYYVNGRSATREDFLSPKVLDSFATAVHEVLEIVGGTVPNKKVWLGETSSAYGGGAPRLSNTYVAGFMWLDKLGLSAQQGIDVVMRQVFFGSGSYHLVDVNFEPLPDYWLSLLYKKLVGTKVLQVSLEGADKRKLRVYLHCTNTLHPKYREGDVTLFALNLYNVTQHLQLPNYLSSKHVDQYLLLPHGKENILSRSIELNGRVLRMVDDKTLPELTEKPLGPGSVLSLPAFSYGFYVIKNAKAIACI